MAVLEGLKPEKVFQFFEMLCSVPHGSGNTKQVSDLCVRFAQERGLAYRQDAFNNIIIWKAASPGYEQAEPLILQGHLDMVCATEPDCGIDMAAEPVRPWVDGDWVKARGTSLGADNGIGVAVALALLDDADLRHPRLEALFTSDEETGMNGAMGVDLSALEGRNLINLDSEEEGYLTVSCAGGLRVDCRFDADWEEAPEGCCFREIIIDGLKGGHSGAEIHKGRASATQLMGRFLYYAEKATGLRVSSMTGGTFTNVIPLACRALVALPADRADAFAELCREHEAMFLKEYGSVEPGLHMRVETPEDAGERTVFSAERTDALLRFMLLAPYGVMAMSADIAGLVKTSLNLGVIRTDEQGIGLHFSLRSSVLSERDMLEERLRVLCETFGAGFSTHDPYPAWEFRKDSPLRDALSAACEQVLGAKPVITATHGGLECGLFMEKRPDFDCVSIGPELHEVHSVRERLSISSTARFYEIMRRLIESWKE